MTSCIDLCCNFSIPRRSRVKSIRWNSYSFGCSPSLLWLHMGKWTLSIFSSRHSLGSKILKKATYLWEDSCSCLLRTWTLIWPRGRLLLSPTSFTIFPWIHMGDFSTMQRTKYFGSWKFVDLRTRKSSMISYQMTTLKTLACVIGINELSLNALRSETRYRKPFLALIVQPLLPQSQSILHLSGSWGASYSPHCCHITRGGDITELYSLLHLISGYNTLVATLMIT